MHRSAKRVLSALLGFLMAGAALAAPFMTDQQVAERLAKLSDSGSAEAAYNLGMFYNNGIGVKQDAASALRYFRLAAERGDPLGAYKVGCYYAGQFGVVPLTKRSR